MGGQDSRAWAQRSPLKRQFRNALFKGELTVSRATALRQDVVKLRYQTGVETTGFMTSRATIGSEKNVRIQPILNFDNLRASASLSDEEFNTFQTQTLATLEALCLKLGSEVLLEALEHPPRITPEGTVLLWFAFSDVEIEAIQSTSDKVRRGHTVLFDYFGDNPLGVLERGGFAGLVTSRSVQSWQYDQPRRFHKMGQGHGLYGLKRLFDATVFDPIFLEVMNSEHYCLFYNYEIHDLDQLLMLYIDSLGKR